VPSTLRYRRLAGRQPFTAERAATVLVSALKIRSNLVALTRGTSSRSRRAGRTTLREPVTCPRNELQATSGDPRPDLGEDAARRLRALHADRERRPRRRHLGTRQHPDGPTAWRESSKIDARGCKATRPKGPDGADARTRTADLLITRSRRRLGRSVGCAVLPAARGIARHGVASETALEPKMAPMRRPRDSGAPRRSLRVYGPSPDRARSLPIAHHSDRQ
jgi:hypothetical protein